MDSRLDRYKAWELLAARAKYSPRQLARSCRISLRQLERYCCERYCKMGGRPNVDKPYVWHRALRRSRNWQLARYRHERRLCEWLVRYCRWDGCATRHRQMVEIR